MHTYMCVSGGKNVSFSENSAYVLNKWSLAMLPRKVMNTSIWYWNKAWKEFGPNVFYNGNTYGGSGGE